MPNNPPAKQCAVLPSKYRELFGLPPRIAQAMLAERERRGGDDDA